MDFDEHYTAANIYTMEEEQHAMKTAFTIILSLLLGWGLGTAIGFMLT